MHTTITIHYVLLAKGIGNTLSPSPKRYGYKVAEEADDSDWNSEWGGTDTPKHNDTNTRWH